MSASMFNQDIRYVNVMHLLCVDTFLFCTLSLHFYEYWFSCSNSMWNTSKVEKMEGMFVGATVFNANVSKWDVSKVRFIWNNYLEDFAALW